MGPNNEEKEKQQVIAIALMEKGLIDTVADLNNVKKTIYGNGTPQNSMMWNLEKLTDVIKKVESQVTELVKDLKTSIENQRLLKEELDNLRHEHAQQLQVATQTATTEAQNKIENSWSAAVKQFIAKSPWPAAIIVVAVVFNKPFITFLTELIQHIFAK